MEKRSRLTFAGLIQEISKLEDEQTLHFKRSCDLYGWGVKKLSIFGVPFMVLVDYTSGIGYTENLPCDYRSTDFLQDFIWGPLSGVSPSRNTGFCLISEQEANTIAFLYEEPAPAEKRISFMEFAEKLLALKTGGEIDFYTEEDGHGWGALKLRLLDADIIVLGIYGGGDTYLYDLTGDDDSAEELAGYLAHALQCHTAEGVYLDPNHNR